MQIPGCCDQQWCLCIRFIHRNIHGQILKSEYNAIALQGL
jgi:hypothetical protein